MAGNPTTSKKLVVTNGVQYYGTGLKGVQKAMSTRYLESSIVVSLHSTLPENMQSAGSKYDYKSGLEIYLKAKAAKTLAKVLKKARNYVQEGNEFEPMAISSGANLIEVSDGSAFGFNAGITITIYSDIGADKKTETYDVFQFSNDKVLLSYDRNEGTYNESFVDTDIEYFIDQLSEFAKATSNASAHVYKKEMAFDFNRMMSRQLQIMDKLGIQNDNYRFNGNAGWANKGVSPTNPTGDAGTRSVNTDDLMSELDNM